MELDGNGFPDVSLSVGLVIPIKLNGIHVDSRSSGSPAAHKWPPHLLSDWGGGGAYMAHPSQTPGTPTQPQYHDHGDANWVSCAVSVHAVVTTLHHFSPMRPPNIGTFCPAAFHPQYPRSG